MMVRAFLALMGAFSVSACAASAPVPPQRAMLAQAYSISSSDWTSDASDAIAFDSRSVSDGEDGQAVALAYDFGRVSGYAFLRHDLDVTLPGNFALRFRIKGVGGSNDLQLKLTDGENVWWRVWRDWRPSSGWIEIEVPAGEIEFAWGPDRDRGLTHADGIELVIARNRDGGSGMIVLDDFEIVPQPGKPQYTSTDRDGDANHRLLDLAAAAPRGTYPRSLSGGMSYWTLAASDGGDASALISEDGAIEPEKGSYSIIPEIESGGTVWRWTDVVPRQSLARGYLPLPAVEWDFPNGRLTTELFTEAQGERVFARYTLANLADEHRQMTLRLAIRPWQVNPPSQFLSQVGGFSPIVDIDYEDGVMSIRQSGEHLADPDYVTRKLALSQIPDSIATGSLPGWPDKDAVTADLAWQLELAPGEQREIVLAMGRGAVAAKDWREVRDQSIGYWTRQLGAVRMSVPREKQLFVDTARSALAHILMSRAGPMLKPGTRSYNRSWIRDGTMMSDALLRSGQANVARKFADWYSGYLFPNGKVPCCVDFRGSDPVPENDSHGEFIYLIAELFRFTADRAALENDWPHVLAAWNYMNQLSQSERTGERADRPTSFGLMPPSISHEGYSARPEYSLWDDFWSLRGFADAAWLAETLGKPEAAAMRQAYHRFALDLEQAIAAAQRKYAIDYLPGAVSLGDFDATSTAIALYPGNAQPILSPGSIEATFERYWQQFEQRRKGERTWVDYTPYELRNVSALLRLGQRDRAKAALEYFMADRRPPAWNGWAEVVGRDPREVRFIGDMPHAWVASDYLRAFLDHIAFEDPAQEAIQLGAGLDADWLSEEGISIENLQTPFGSLDFSAQGDASRLRLAVGGTARPPGGYLFRWPFDTPPPPARRGDRTIEWDGTLLRIAPQHTAPIMIEIGGEP